MKMKVIAIVGLAIVVIAAIILAAILSGDLLGNSDGGTNLITKSASQMLIEETDMPNGWVAETLSLLPNPSYPVKEFANAEFRVNGPAGSTAVLAVQVMIFTNLNQAESAWENYKANMTSFQSSQVYHFDECMKYSVGAGTYQLNLYAFHEKNVMGYLEIGKNGYDLSSGFNEQMLSILDSKIV